ncbi:MAG TPA: YebC/PmpR family DNA-binding transcriptional regulator [Syntrophorhabdaceae bacterium]|jgi:YebC/PmpR family DNA-binding regulatory protein|nr:YebC/PmpR family DNA-binding transcriptional regulator [Syntrophorhabdaceae bacterium]HNZ58111.1 YebC/PmpR family DNA-binding transcriptional regulator [Syntrophorhabdaceae bacterium]HOF57285.1 YebC/PmpR family DNA-binding transcriptional regulator [Syntrophorhabdaceae bacterium]HOG39645.1 YebC/PmpR family DNA-binding transcriptional regulator [Syntrophorhabdaceae bacterium]HOS05893.1 YebC/PmpR family DNA-binding transcriptional regulator [Syntrophorhabdaceae bacterium]
MSGHSKWSSIKHKKGAADAKRGKMFTKLIKEITTAARIGGGDPDTNARLRVAVAQAKAENMPKENIERAIKKGIGAIEGESYEEYTYEGYGPGGVAILIEVLTDNKKRTTAEIRHILSRLNGNMGEAGCVSWMFNKKGYFAFDNKTTDEDKIMELALESGAEDISTDENEIEVITDVTNFDQIKKVFDTNNLKYSVAEISMIPQMSVKLEGKNAETMLKLMEMLEDSDDVQRVYANFDISFEEMEKITSNR